MVAVLAIDQVTKHAVRSSIVEGEQRKLLPGIELVHTRNRGVAFGLLPGSQVLVTVLIGLALLALAVYFTRHAVQPLLWLPTGMLLGGALGNVLDRVREGSVTDFIKLPLGWPPFNLADTSIVLGVVLLFLIVDHKPPPRTVSEPFRVAYEDEYLIVVDKAAGVVVHPARGHPDGTLAQLLAGRAGGGDPERAGIVHRLDRDTSGPACRLAQRRGSPAAAGGARAARDRARVPGARTGAPAGALGHDRGADRARPAGAHADGRAAAPGLRSRAKPARTSRSSGRSPARRCCACAWRRVARTRYASTCRPSGILCAAIRSTGRAAVLGLERQFLHSTRLSFDHPLTGERVDVSSPLPADLARALELAARS